MRHDKRAIGRGRIVAASGMVIPAMLLSACVEREQPVDARAYWSGIAPVEVARGRAQRGPWRMNESDFDYVDDPAVAIAEDGHIGVVWADQARHDLFFQLYTPKGEARFDRPVNVSVTPRTFSWMPRLAVAPDGRHFYLLWQEIVFSGGSHGGEIFFARSVDAGVTFSAPVNLSNSVAGDGKGRIGAERWDNGSLDLALGPERAIYAAWTEYEGRLWVSRSTDAGATFTKPLPVAANMSQAARAPSLAVDGNGRVHLAWASVSRRGSQIRIAASTDGGQSFGASHAVPTSGFADAPRIAAGADGQLHLVYAETDPQQAPRGRIRYTRWASGTPSFSEPRTIVEGVLGRGGVNFPDIATDAANQVYIVWKLVPRGQRSHGLGFTLSRDGGENFTTPTIVPGSDDPRLGFSGSLQSSLMAPLAVSAGGEIALVNSTFVPAGSSHIWLWRRSTDSR